MRAGAIVEAAELLGNTAFCRPIGVHRPRVIDLFEAGHSPAPLPRTQDAADLAVVRLLTES